MLCQNCGRRSSDKPNFCPYCGAVASQDVSASTRLVRESSFRPSSLTPRPPAQRPSPQMRPGVPRPPQPPRAQTYHVSYDTSRKSSASSSGLSSIVFLAVAFGMAYWLTKSDDFDLLTFLRSAIESTLNQSVDSPSQSRPARPLTMPATAGPSAPPVSPAGASRDSRGSIDVEGFSQDQ